MTRQEPGDFCLLHVICITLHLLTTDSTRNFATGNDSSDVGRGAKLRLSEYYNTKILKRSFSTSDGGLDVRTLSPRATRALAGHRNDFQGGGAWSPWLEKSSSENSETYYFLKKWGGAVLHRPPLCQRPCLDILFYWLGRQFFSALFFEPQCHFCECI